MITVPEHLNETVGGTSEGSAWLRVLPDRVAAIAERWSLRLAEPIAQEATCSWVAPGTMANGEEVVLKLGYPHMEAKHEIDGLEFWAGDPTALLIRSDRDANAMLLERCIPGRCLRDLPEDQQDAIIAQSLRRLWREPKKPHPFRPLAEMIELWCREIRADEELWPDEALVREGLSALVELAEPQREEVLLATDLHAGNILSAQRHEWLVIDPKPFTGDPCYDATQHLLNCRERMLERPVEMVARLAGLLGVDERRVRHWTFARFAVSYGQNASAAASIAARLSL